MYFFFPEGVSPSYAGLMPEVLASGKVVWGDPCTEGSQTAKACTDEQEEYVGITQYHHFGTYEAYLSG